MTAYYNEIDPYAAAWLRDLIREGSIADGDVDERSIVDVHPDDLRGYTQCHFFAGIGGWSYALRLAGWADDRAVWTGSCPCQPYSAAGLQLGDDDPRNLWPELRRLIAECDPAVVFGEQVASRAGRGWLAGVRADLEALGYGVGAADLCAAGVGAPHIRQRLWWVADSNKPAGGGHVRDVESTQPEAAPTLHRGCDGDVSVGGSVSGSSRRGWGDEWIACADGKSRRIEPGIEPLAHGVSGRVAVERTRTEAGTKVQETHWYNRLGALRGFGNAIVPEVAETFIRAYDGV